jgi:hypothetical protein
MLKILLELCSKLNRRTVLSLKPPATLLASELVATHFSLQHRMVRPRDEENEETITQGAEANT